jgi:hypothetical protein
VDLVSAELPAKTLVVAIDPGKVTHRVIVATGEKGLIGEPVSLSTQREGVENQALTEVRIEPNVRRGDFDIDVLVSVKELKPASA